MEKQKIFFIFLVFLGSLCAGYFSLRAASALFDFFTFKESTLASITRWEIKETGGKFPLTAYYSFEAQGNIWKGATRLKEPWHLNEASAIIDLQEKAKQSWVVWFNPDHPSKSSLIKEFPTSLVIRTFLCCIVFVYFILFFR